MNYKDLTREQLLLLNTDFGEYEKVAEAYVEDEYEKVAELEDIAASCMAYGEELAMQKIAEMEAYHQEKIAAEEEKKEMKGLEKKEDDDDEEEEKSEEEKNASAMGQFILEGYWNTMMEKGAEYYGDPDIYLEELAKESGFDKVAKKAAKPLLDRLKGYFTAQGIKGSKNVQERAKQKLINKMKGTSNEKHIEALLKSKKKKGAGFLSDERAQRIAKKRQYGAAATAGGGLAGLGFMGGRASKD